MVNKITLVWGFAKSLLFIRSSNKKVKMLLLSNYWKNYLDKSPDLGLVEHECTNKNECYTSISNLRLLYF